MTMVLRLSGGHDSSIENCILVLRNQDIRYPIRGVPNTINFFILYWTQGVDEHYCNAFLVPRVTFVPCSSSYSASRTVR